MTRDEMNAICAAMPGAEISSPFGPGHDIWKVGGKIFAAMGAQTPGISVKTESVEVAQMLKDAGVGAKAPYFHRSWILLPLDCDEEEAKHRIARSYALIRAGLPKKLQAELG
ncbi:MmcQ/YjbR family DNA-binding protein [Pararhodobacter oceanensis]|uniref:MmcQ/YjbR family DNA-binding protein n=1 Tax=Pararhodobacter oceanensis TaxID=2172121 RepID=A0A2T8HY73_9RHOB|nr:MmcQ/YjbR family DNA-binding protein [Pararhodobacter oceanensis]PVH30390.1 hypothetical protein DDE20_02245 [Pararhodobacter oceanensis]